MVLVDADVAQRLEEEAKNLKRLMNTLSMEKQEIDDDKNDKLKSMAVLELSISDAEKLLAASRDRVRCRNFFGGD